MQKLKNKSPATEPIIETKGALFLIISLLVINEAKMRIFVMHMVFAITAGMIYDGLFKAVK